MLGPSTVLLRRQRFCAHACLRQSLRLGFGTLGENQGGARSEGYRDSVGRWITVEAGEIAACTVDYPLAFAKMLVAFERAGPSRPSPLIDGFVWDVGTIRLTGAKSPVPVWFARRLTDPAVWTRLDALLERRPPEEVRVILTSTPGDRIPITPNKRNVIVGVADVLGTPGKLAISPQSLGARVFPGQVQRRFPIDHSEECGLVWHRGETLTFGGDKQRRLLQILFAAYRSKSPVLRIAAVLEARAARSRGCRCPRQSIRRGGLLRRRRGVW